MQQYADIYLLQSHSTCFGCPQHPSLGVLNTVTAASGTGHNIGTATSLQRGLSVNNFFGGGGIVAHLCLPQTQGFPESTEY